MAEIATVQSAMGGEGAPSSALSGVPRYRQRKWLVFLSFLAFVVARYVQLGARRDILATVRFELLLGVVVMVLVFQEIGSRPPVIGRGKNLLIAISALFFAMVIQLPFAADPVVARTIFMDRVIKFALMTFMMVVLVESPHYLRWFIAAFLFSVFYITLESVRGLISGGLVWQNQGVMRLHGAVPIYEHPNSLGGVAMGALPFAAFLFAHLKTRLMKLGMLALSTTSLVCVVYSGSRTAYVGLIAFILWWYFQSDRKGRFLMWGLIFGAIGLSVTPAEYIDRFKSIGGQEKEGHSSETRMVILQDAWVILQENPFGVGVASFPAVRQRRFGRMQDTHNLYLEVGTNLGVQGLAVFLFLVGAMMAEFRRTALDFRAQVAQLMRAGRVKGLPQPLRSRLSVHVRELKFLISSAQAAGGFILIRLVLGLFGMDLYEVYWWFGAGLALILSGLVVATRRNTKILLESVRAAVA